MVRKTILLCAAFFFLVTPHSYGQAWYPTPLAIDVPDAIHYVFNGSAVDIPFSLTGGTAMVWLVINTYLDDGQKPVAIRNGFKGWHFVNGIDTTVYVSSGRVYEPGAYLTFPWDGQSNERVYEDYQDSGVIDLRNSNFMSYYLFGYGNTHVREIANDFIPIGYYSQPQYARFYCYDDITGAVLSQPLLMGNAVFDFDTSPRLVKNTFFKFRLGDDPNDETLIETTRVSALGQGEGMGSGLFQSDDFNTFYFIKNKRWENLSTVVKYSFIPGGEAVQDTMWGDFTKVAWWSFESTADSVKAIMQSDEEYLYISDNSSNQPLLNNNLIRAFPWSDLEDIQFEVFLDEFWAPNAPVDAGGMAWISGEVNRFEPGPKKGWFYLAGDKSCLTELVDCHKMLDGANEPFAIDGNGYVVWANSNGDFFCDKNAYPYSAPYPVNPSQLWACHAAEPRNFNNMRMAPSPVDMNGFMVTFLEFAGLYDCAVFTQDGSGIGYLFSDDFRVSPGGDIDDRKGNGTILDCGSQYDGIYKNTMLEHFPSWGDPYYFKTCWIPFDSDGGILFKEYVDVVEEILPQALILESNYPNPFNPSTTICFTLLAGGQVTVDVYNVAGQKVSTLLDNFMPAGDHSVVWDATDFPAGVYFYTVTAGEFTRTMKMMLMK